jgi:type I restriction enzyme S subunit
VTANGGTFPRGFSSDTRFAWPLVRANELVELQYGKALVAAKRKPGSIPVYGTNGRCGWHNERLFPGPGVVLGRKGMGPLGVEWSGTDYWVIDTAYTVAPKVKSLHLKFFYYLIKYIGLNHLKDGTSNPSLSRETFGAQLLPLPSLHEEQQAIAEMLSSLDDKIELNRRTNRTLEQIASAIFKAWFVDFEPVKAKAAGATRFPTMPQPVFDALPTEFTDSPIGSIPKGWEMGILEDLLLLQRGFDLPKTQRTPGPYAVMAASGPNGMHNEYKVRGPGVTTGRSGVLGNVFLVQDHFWPLNTSLWVKEYRRSSPYHAFFALQLLDLAAFNAGSAVPTLNRNHLHNLPVVVSPAGIVESFTTTAEPLFRMKRSQDLESETLAALRDALLPKLLSGEIRLEAAGKVVAEVV